METLTFTKIASGIYKTTTGENIESMLSMVGNTPKLDAADSFSQEVPLPFDSVCTEKVDGKTVVCIPRDLSEHHYGPGLRFRGISTNYSVLHLRCDHYGGSDNGRTHVPTPFYLSDKGYGIYIDTPEFITFYMGGTVRTDAKNPPKEYNRGRGEWYAETPSEFVEASFSGDADIYLFTGRNMLEVVARFNLLCGGGPLIPKWSFGFWQRTHIHCGEEDIKKEISLFEEKDFDLDVIGLEPGWHTNSYPCTYEWDSERFPDPKRFVSDLLKKNIRVNLWENLFVSRKASIYDSIKPYCGSHKVWNGIVPDLTIPKARQILADQHKKEHADIGVSGYKIDECDGYDGWLFPDHARFPSGNNAAVVRNSFGILAQKNIYEMYREENRRTFGLVRASAAGSSMMPFCIYNDCYSFDQYMTGLASSSLCGCLWVPEVRDAKTEEEWVRRFQMCVFSPMLMLNGWSNAAKPWKFPNVENIIRDTLRFRKSLLPYLYDSFYTYFKKGIPPFRAMCLDFSVSGHSEKSELDHTDNPYETVRFSDVVDQYMAGDSIMVCPMRPDQTKRKVLLPPCDWYDYYTGEYAGNAEEIEIECGLDRIPLFVKAGGMIPTTDGNGTLTVRCYGDHGESFIYDDDGETFDYEKGQYALFSMSFEKKNGTVKGTITQTYSNEGFESGYKTVQFI